MPTLNTDHYLLQMQGRANLSRLAPENVSSGQIEVTAIRYTQTGSEATGDVLNLCVLPAGVIPLPHLSTVFCSADPGTTVTIDIGTAADTDGWADGMALGALSSGGALVCTAPAVPAWITPTPLVADTAYTTGNAVVKATLETVSSATAGVVLTFLLAYVRGK